MLQENEYSSLLDLLQIYGKFLAFLLGKKFAGTKLFPSNKMWKVAGDLSRMQVKAGDNFQHG